jgi:hypothetical protein
LASVDLRHLPGTMLLDGKMQPPKYASMRDMERVGRQPVFVSPAQGNC